MMAWLPPGSEHIAAYARTRRLGYDAKPAEDFFRRWEPHDTIVSPELWYNACTQPTPWGGHVTVAEPWTAGDDRYRAGSVWAIRSASAGRDGLAGDGAAGAAPRP